MKRLTSLLPYLSLFFSLILGSATCEKTKGGVADCIDERKINPDAACIMIYDPVCGCDGKTYSNSCVAENAGVTRWTKGECE